MYDTRRHNIHDVYTTDTGLCVYVAHTVFIPNFESFSVGEPFCETIHFGHS